MKQEFYHKHHHHHHRVFILKTLYLLWCLVILKIFPITVIIHKTLSLHTSVYSEVHWSHYHKPVRKHRRTQKINKALHEPNGSIKTTAEDTPDDGLMKVRKHVGKRREKGNKDIVQKKSHLLVILIVTHRESGNGVEGKNHLIYRQSNKNHRSFTTVAHSKLPKTSLSYSQFLINWESFGAANSTFVITFIACFLSI